MKAGGAVFGRKKKTAPVFDRAGKEPVVRASICTGEKVAGYRDIATGKFKEVMLIRSDADLEQFLASYGFRPEEVKREW